MSERDHRRNRGRHDGGEGRGHQAKPQHGQPIVKIRPSRKSRLVHPDAVKNEKPWEFGAAKDVATALDPSLMPKGPEDFVQKTIKTSNGEALFVSFLDHNGKVVRATVPQYNTGTLQKLGLYLSDKVKVDRSELRQQLQIQFGDSPKIQNEKKHVRGLIATMIGNEMQGSSFADRVKISEEILNQYVIRHKNGNYENFAAMLKNKYWQTKANHVSHSDVNLRALDVALLGTHLIGPGTGNGSAGVMLGKTGIVTAKGRDGAGSVETFGIEEVDRGIMKRLGIQLVAISHERNVDVAAKQEPAPPPASEKSAPASLPAPTAVVPIQPTVAGLKTQYGPTPTSGVKANAEPVVVESIMGTSGATVDPPEPSQRDSRRRMASFKTDYPALASSPADQAGKVVVAGGSDIEAAFDNWSKARTWPTLNSTQ